MESKLIRKIASRVASGPNPLEGSLGAPTGQVISHLQEFLSAKYAIDIAYRSFADRVRGPWRDAIVTHWHDHAKDERDSSYQLAMKIVGLGGDPIQTGVMVPPCTANVQGFIKVLMDLELKAISNGRKLIELAGLNTSLKVLAENIILTDTHHLDDLRRLCEVAS